MKIYLTSIQLSITLSIFQLNRMETLMQYKEGKADNFDNISMNNKKEVIAMAIKGKWHLI